MNKCMHYTAPGKIQYGTDGNSRALPTNSIPDPSINLMWHFVLEVGMVGRFLEINIFTNVG